MKRVVQLRCRLNDLLNRKHHLRLLSRRASTVALFVGMRESNFETQRKLHTLQQRAEMVFKYAPGPLEITPGLARAP